MKCVILAGGLGTRLSEETTRMPKPMVEVGDRPILWHIMKVYGHWGIRDFIICLGYKGYVIKEYFANYNLHVSDVTLDLSTGNVNVLKSESEPWRVMLIDTGLETMTGGRIRRILPLVRDDREFMLTYGDGLADINIPALLSFHRNHGKLATVTAVPPPKRFGQLAMEGSKVTEFQEKPDGEGGFINGGFFVLSPGVSTYLDGDAAVWEREPLQRLAADGQLCGYQHPGFWQPMDTLRDKVYLETLWVENRAPWKLWL
jgi:glucose-1-phosphate cytidylyltransferase